jgi:heme exporter protein B
MTRSKPSEPIGLLHTSWVLLRKDLLIEWRTRARVNALIFFALSTLLLFSFALGPDTKLLERNAGGYLWLAILFASTLSLGESFRVEYENACLDGLRLVPADARAIFLSKAVGNTLLLILLGQLLATLVLGCMALAAPGTVYAAIANNARARDVLLPLLLFPLIVPALLASAKGMMLVLQGDPMEQLGSWFGLLGAFNLIYWGLGFVLFPRVIED